MDHLNPEGESTYGRDAREAELEAYRMKGQKIKAGDVSTKKRKKGQCGDMEYWWGPW